MKIRKQFATTAQRAAWQAECRREAAKRMLRRLMRELSRVAREPLPPGQHQLAQQYRVARAAHVNALQRERDADNIERVKIAMDELQMDLA
jgi:hypothetical protein